MVLIIDNEPEAGGNSPFRCIGTLQGHNGKVLSCAFSTDGSLLASGGADKKVYLINLFIYRFFFF